MSDSQLGVREMIEMLWKRRLFIVLVTTFCVVVAGVGGKLAGKYYKATTLLAVAAADTANLGGLGSMLSQIGPLASLAGLSGGGMDQRSESLAVLQSRALTIRFIQENDLLPKLYPDLWDAKAKTWKVQSPAQVPTLWKANEYFKRIRTVVEDRKTGLITLTVKWNDPETAAEWANGLVKTTNQYLREQAMAESERNISYLSDQVSKNEFVAVRTALYGLVENEIKQNMLARGREDYALKIIDPAMTPEFPASPRLLVWLIGGFMGGLFIAVLSIFLRAAWIEAR